MIVLLMQVLRPLTRMPSRENISVVVVVVFSDHDYPFFSFSLPANKVVSDSLGPVDFCDLAFELFRATTYYYRELIEQVHVTK